MSNTEPFLCSILLQMFKCIILVETFQLDAVIDEFDRSETQGLRVSSRPPINKSIILSLKSHLQVY